MVTAFQADAREFESHLVHHFMKEEPIQEVHSSILELGPIEFTKVKLPLFRWNRRKWWQKLLGLNKPPKHVNLRKIICDNPLNVPLNKE